MKTIAEIIWDEIRNKELDLFGLPGQTVEKYFEPKFIPYVDILYLKSKLSVATAALENLIQEMKNDYLMDISEDCITIMINNTKKLKMESPLITTDDKGSILIDVKLNDTITEVNEEKTEEMQIKEGKESISIDFK